METFNVIEASRKLFLDLEHVDPEVYNEKKDVVFANAEEALSCVSDVMLHTTCTKAVATNFGPVLLELLTRSTESKNGTARKEKLFIALGKLIWSFPDATRFAYRYFENSSNIFSMFEEEVSDGESEMKRKRLKTDLDIDFVVLKDLLMAGLQFLAYDYKFFRDIWDWTLLTSFAEFDDLNVKWLSYQCLFQVTNISSQEQNIILSEVMNHEDILKYQLMYNDIVHQVNNYRTSTHIADSGSPKYVTARNLSSTIVNVEGVLLEKFDSDTEHLGDPPLVLVNSAKAALNALALGVACGAPILLQGPVGCGKTSLLEHLARATNRNPHTDLLKIQLGDQMDSKLLLGNYCCTETPGEFVWQAGILTQAMVSGYWLLLEDIDCAPVEVIMTLAPIVESRSVVLPGHINPVKAHPSFQLFATQRLLTGRDRSYIQSKNHSDRLKRFWRRITIQNLSNDELNQIISEKWPFLTPILDRILVIYQQFSKLGFTEGSVDSQKTRLISTRDLFKFCKRISEGFNLQSSETSTTAFQHALDSFCGSFPSVCARVTAAECIGMSFNIPKSKASYYCTKYKPDVEVYHEKVLIGRAIIEIRPEEEVTLIAPSSLSFAYTRQAIHLLERVSVAVMHKEPVLLVGETGTGKTSIVQFLAHQTNNKLTVINMNQQSDSVDLLGGYKPVDLRLVVAPLRDEFVALFPLSFSLKQNGKFLGHITKCFLSKRWDDLFSLMIHSQKAATEKFSNTEDVPLPPEVKSLSKRWKRLGQKVMQLKLQIQQSKTPLVFSFIEGALVKAMKKGDWLLLDEINLAEAETLQCLSGVLESDVQSLYLLEKGEPVPRHPDFRLFACMNPATDIGKKDLPIGIRNRFTEFFVEELEDKHDLLILVESYLSALTANPTIVENCVNFYLHLKTELIHKLNDGTGNRPHYSLRTLCRALTCAANHRCGGVFRSLFEGFALSFLSQLECRSYPIVMDAIVRFLLSPSHTSVLSQKIPEPPGSEHVHVEGFWIPIGPSKVHVPKSYVLTKSVKLNLRNLARIVSIGQYPVLLQGETSVGKTSLIQYLANATGNHCVRVNNHEHTDIEEYVGSYCADQEGKLVFKEGILVEAMRKGYWIILDELNLAPSEVMEALNRVLDDNRELFITETQQTVKAHPKFMVFATQNPPGLYGGRKFLSRAFRNRFIELYFDEIPQNELEIILEQRCSVPESYCKKMVAVMQDLQLHRRESGIFCGKRGFITLRDLFRWGERYRLSSQGDDILYDWTQHLADEGYMLLAGRVRRVEEEVVIKNIIEKHMKRKIKPDLLFSFDSRNTTAADILKYIGAGTTSEAFSHVVLTPKMKRMAILLGKALKYEEPVLLIGNTGCGKTTMCQMFAEFRKKKLHIVNCHMHSESADFLGNLRPVRLHDECGKLFEWVDGPLVMAMEQGDFFLTDEISLADDSVLERMNSVLEPQRELRITEKSSEYDDDQTVIVAKKDFRIMATMNPGGDYGKKELSPALRNRFTEIWCPSDLANEEYVSIIENNIRKGLQLFPNRSDSGFGIAIVEFLDWFRATGIGKRMTISIRDILTWANFINAATAVTHKDGCITSYEAYIHGACLLFLDCLGSVGIADPLTIADVKALSCRFFEEQFDRYSMEKDIRSLKHSLLHNWDGYCYSERMHCGVGHYGFGPFFIPAADTSQQVYTPDRYNLDTSATKCNAVRVMRAMQLWRPILLEGIPGVGKTSLVSTLANAGGYELVRINLSEQTDISDLFGTDLPVDGGESGEFAWCDGPFLEALKAGSWVLLDELNLASQSVLEGLNACLDHRGEIYIPELGKTFSVSNQSTRIFGCQNPQRIGGSRKGLPKSFLNRFIQVYMEPFSSTDLKLIVSYMYPLVPSPLIVQMIEFNDKVVTDIEEGSLCRGNSHMYTFNLRDIFRWCDVMQTDQMEDAYNPAIFVNLIYGDRMRTIEDKRRIMELRLDHFGMVDDVLNHQLRLHIFDNYVQIGHSMIERRGRSLSSGQLQYPLHCQLLPLESLMKCIQMNWLAILVGPTSSGKTTMVKLLAEMTGNTLKVINMNSEMDTSELLGGFEQVNLCRHLDDVIEDLQPYLQRAFYICMRDSDYTELIPELLSIMFKLYDVNLTRSNIIDYGLHICRRRLRYLNHVFVILDKMQERLQNHLVLNEMKRKISEVADGMEINGVSSVGGRFEWVDSVLIQAVERGYWILLEDANLCSPSVLDRLNSMFEPGGVLTLAEQGCLEFEDGPKARISQPHPDFRIIFTVNPLNGEVSPAMRNRGMEIAIPNEILSFEPGDIIPDNWDLCSLMHSRQMCDPHAIHYLRDIYCKLCYNSLTRPNSSDFQNTIDLCIQLLQKNRHLSEALLGSFSMAFNGNVLDHVIREQNSLLIHEAIDADAEAVWNPNFYHNKLIVQHPSSIDFHHSYEFSSVMQHSLFIRHLLRLFLDKLMWYSDPPNTISFGIDEFTFPSVTETIRWIMTFTTALEMYFESASLKQWQLFCIWFDVVLDEIMDKMLQEKCEQRLYFEPIANSMQQLMRQHYTKFPHSGVALGLGNAVDGILNTLKCDKIRMFIAQEDLPIDLRWNQPLLQRFLHDFFRIPVSDECDLEGLSQDLFSVSNRYLLLLKLSTIQFVLTNIQDESGQAAKTEPSLYDLGKEACAGTRSLDTLPHPAVAQLPNFLSWLYDMMVNEFTHSPKCYTEEYFWQLWQIIKIYEQFLHFCMVSTSRTTIEDLDMAFPLYCTKLIKEFAYAKGRYHPVISLLEDSDMTLQTMISSLGMENMSLQKLRLKTIRAFGCPSAFPTENVANTYLDILDIRNQVNISSLLRSENSGKDLQIFFSNGLKWNHVMLNAVCESFGTCHDDKYVEVSASVNEMKIQLQDMGFLGNITEIYDSETCQQPSLLGNVSENQMSLHVELLPLWEYFFLHAEAVFLNYTAEMIKSPFTTVTSMQKLTEKFLIDVGVNKLNYDPVHIGQFLTLYKDEKKGLFSVCLASFLHAVQCGLLANSQEVCFNWSRRATAFGKKKAQSSKKIHWEKHSPLLTMCCLRVLGNPDIGGSMTLPLRNIVGKKQQIETLKSLLWRSRESLGKETFWQNMASIVSYWFDHLVAALSCFVTIDLRTNLTDMLEQMWLDLKLSDILKYDQGRNVLVDARNCVLSMTTLLKRENREALDLSWSIGCSFVKVGLLTLVLFAPVYSHDPVLKHRLSHDCCEKLIEDSAMELQFHNWQSQTLGSKDLKYIEGDIHPFLSGLSLAILKLKGKLEKKKCKLAYRPSPSQFSKLVNDVQQYLNLIGSPTAACEMMAALDVQRGKILDDQLSSPELLRSVKQLNTQIESLKSFVNSLLDKYPLYRDLVYPFVTGLEMLLLGYQLLSKYLTGVALRKKFPNMKSIESQLIKMCSFPTLNDMDLSLTPMQLASYLGSEESLKCFADTRTASEMERNDNSVFKILKSSLLEVTNEVLLLKSTTGREALAVADPILKQFYKTLERQDEDMKRKKEIEESLYEQKVKTYGGEKTEEELIVEGLKFNFPSYEEDYRDVLLGEPEAEGKLPETPKVTQEVMSITPEDIFEIWICHATLVAKLQLPRKDYEKAIGFIVQKITYPDFQTPYLLRYEVFRNLLPALHNVDPTIDSHMIGGHLLAGSALQLQNDIQTGKLGCDSEEHYDFYHDPNTIEAMQFIPILEPLSCRVNTLLKEFPDNPILEQMLNILWKIMSLPVTSPLIKFVTGLEIFLETSQSWEQSGQKDSSLQLQLDVVTRKVIYCRKLENKCWGNCLDSVIKKYYMECSKWWFRIYSLVFSKKEEKLTSLLSSLQQFLEDCPLGQFEARLEMIQTFFLHITIIVDTEYKRKMRDVLFSVHSFYKQFLSNIRDRISIIRKPIEKELKEFVQISKWNDSNFFSVKKSVEKTHRTLHKFMHKFETELGQLARKFFQIEGKPSQEFSSTVVNPMNFIVVQDVPMIINDQGRIPTLKHDGIFDEIGIYYRKSKNLCRKSLQNFMLSKYINNLEEVSEGILEKLHNIRSMEVKKTGNKKSELKHFRQNVQLKRKALSDLLKDLKELGLSYRKGLIYCENQKNCEKRNSMLAPSISADIWKHLDVTFGSSLCNIISSWEDANTYYYKSVAQFSLLEVYAQSPNKVLKTVTSFESFRGLSGHVMQTIISHRHQFASEARPISNVCESISSLVNLIFDHKSSDINVVKPYESLYFPPQNIVRKWKVELSGFLVQTAAAFHQFELLLKCCPQETDDQGIILHPDVSSPLSCCIKGDKLWTNLVCDIRTHLEDIKTITASSLPSLESRCKVYTWQHFHIIRENFKKLAEIVNTFAQRHCLRFHSLDLPETNETNFTSFMFNLQVAISSQWNRLNEDFATVYGIALPILTEREEEIAKLSERLLKKVLKAIENVFTHCSTTVPSGEDDQEESDANLFSDKFSSNLSKLSECLNIRHIWHLLRKIMKNISAFEGSPAKIPVFERYVLSMVPILHQYSQLMKLYLIMVVHGQLASCRLLSSMLEIFLEYAQKGFGNPPENADPTASGGLEFHSIEQGGLGEGEGSKDVSKNIKSEDQLDDATVEGSERKEGEAPDVKEEEDGIEMSEDFEGKAHDPELRKEGDGDSDEGSDLDEDELDKKMGDVGDSEADKLDEQVWGDESEEDEAMSKDDCGQGVSQNEQSEMVAKGSEEKQEDRSKNNGLKDMCPDLRNEDEYDGEQDDPLIDAPPLLEPEVMELPEELRLDSDEDEANDDDNDGQRDGPEDDNNTMDIDTIEGSDGEEDSSDPTESEDRTKELQSEDNEDTENGTEKGVPEEILPDKHEEEDESLQENADETPSNDRNAKADKAQSSAGRKGASQDLVEHQDDVDMWEGEAQGESEQQRREGHAGYDEKQLMDRDQRGTKSSAPHSDSDDMGPQSKRPRRADQRRTLGEVGPEPPERVRIRDSPAQRNDERILGQASEYEHVQDDQEGHHQALDAATEEQVMQQPPPLHRLETKSNDDEPDVIDVDSSSDEEEVITAHPILPRGIGNAPRRNALDEMPGEENPPDVEMEVIDEGEVIQTHHVAPYESSIHTHYALWATLSAAQEERINAEIERKLTIWKTEKKTNPELSYWLWQDIEAIVSPLVQDLCEHLRLVLEPTKMSKLRGDYRTGKRLNMRKIIPYIASQFRKDKIWLRRTKPCQREYQIMIAMDDSYSMSDNHSKKLAYQALALLGKSLSMIEAGQLAVTSFGEDVTLLQDFEESFTSSTGARLLESFTFAQNKTRICQLVEYATTVMLNAGHKRSKLASRETSQLLLIISDGRGVFNEGEESLKAAVRQARACNIFIVFIVLDSPLNKDSILDVQRTQFDAAGNVQLRSYMESFPFPFYVILRSIDALPQVLGEALRQWFELVSTVPR